MINIISNLSNYAIPVIFLGIATYGYIKKVPLFDVFTEGASEGFEMAVKIIPFLVGMLISIGIFRASGAMEYLCKIISPITNLVGMPEEVVPMALLRPISGSGANGVMLSIFKEYGPDSFLGTVASVMSGATDTTLYIIAVYFGSVGIKNSRYALKAGLIGDIVGLISAVILVKLFM